METALDFLSKNVGFRWVKITLFPSVILATGFVLLFVSQFAGWENIIETAIVFCSDPIALDTKSGFVIWRQPVPPDKPATALQTRRA